MSGPVQVRSVAAIESFRASLVEFEKQARSALDVLTAELRRATDWLEHDCPAFWQCREKEAADAVHQAKLDLERCLIFPVAGEYPACREEKAALKKAQDHLTYCHDKRGQVHHWRGVLQHEVYEYHGRIGHLTRLLENELPAARAKLQLIIRRIEEYQIERPVRSKDATTRVPGPNE